MHARLSNLLALLGLSVSLAAGAQASTPSGGDFSQGAQTNRLPTGVILVKGAWSSASDAVTPLPEGGKVSANVYDNPYFGFTLSLPGGWTQQYDGPPPSDSGYYVLAQIQPADTVKGATRGTILIAAQDMFFTPIPAASPLEMIQYTKDHLRADYRVERPLENVTIAGRSFVRLGYVSPVAGLHWYMLATQIRCHVVQFVFTSGDTRWVESLVRAMNGTPPSAQAALTSRVSGVAVPMCLKDYAIDANILEKVDPAFTEQRFNPVPVRLVIDKQGRVGHIHFLSAFPAQAKAITDALSLWRFKPYLNNGEPVEVETGIMFGRGSRPATQGVTAAVSN